MDRVIFADLFGADWTLAALMIPIINGIVGFGTNWLAVQMVFKPIKFFGIRTPWFFRGIRLGGWQGVVPARGTMMTSIFYDSALAKVGSPQEIFESLDPQFMGNHVANQARGDIHRMADELIQKRHPELWGMLPDQVKAMVHKRIDDEVPNIMTDLLGKIAPNIEKLLDLKLMVVRELGSKPKDLNNIFKTAGDKELKFLAKAGFLYGVPLGILPMLIYIYTGQPDAAFFINPMITVPLGAAFCGYMTNWIALKMIFQPLHPKKVMGFTFYGLLLKRQAEIAVMLAQIVAHQVLTLPTMLKHLFRGPDEDRVRKLMADTVTPVVDKSVGAVAPLVKAVAGGQISGLTEEFAVQGVDLAESAFADEQFARDRQEKIADLVGVKLGQMPGDEFGGMLKVAIEKDEWALTALGALLGFLCGAAQVMAGL